ncbi:sulfotransferase [Sulfitobacter albidus]|uniref:Sulfotransferase n=1 Tax=Sulfitobacter albidus TaxID=2829501 RepID=A0A975JCK4_9RHOB|nr:sulfotransferase [Sulfitobacter albidus]QUJ76004.1 sulfotransferase [Sulfitobacter albidus]
MKRFVILGLPRSGSTYLMTLLNAHRDVICTGEQFNPYAVISDGPPDDSHDAVMGRDRDPVAHMKAVFDQAEIKGVACGGFKYMIGHNIKILQEIASDPEIAIINIWRENKLAQVSSLIKAANNKKWAQTKADDHVTRKIVATPRQISHRWHEYATFDHLIAMWLDGLPNPKVRFEYREMFRDGFEDGLCDFLGVARQKRLKSPLVKQSSNAILDRFEDPNPIRYYFTQAGLAHWLEDEL